jgi:hypothetical protein
MYASANRIGLGTNINVDMTPLLNTNVMGCGSKFERGRDGGVSGERLEEIEV